MTQEKPIELSLEDEDALLERGAKKALAQGAYNPYDVDPRRGKKAVEKGNTTRTDLRQLSKWIKLKREIEDLKAEEERADESADEPRIQSKK